MSSAALILYTGSGTPVTFEIKNVASIGRAEDNSIILKDDSVSRHHARISRQGSSWLIEDLGSANGILVNGKPCKRYILYGGETISIGRINLTFEVSKTIRSAPTFQKTKINNVIIRILSIAAIVIFGAIVWHNINISQKATSLRTVKNTGRVKNSVQISGTRLIPASRKKKAKRYYNKALFFLQIGDLRQSLKWLKKSLSLYPTYRPALIKRKEVEKMLKSEIEKRILAGDRELKRLQVDFAIMQYKKALSLAQGFNAELAKNARLKIIEAERKKRILEEGNAED